MPCFAHLLCSIYREAYLPLHTPFNQASTLCHDAQVKNKKNCDISLFFDLLRWGKLATALQVTAAAEAKQKPVRNDAAREYKAERISFGVVHIVQRTGRVSKLENSLSTSHSRFKMKYSTLPMSFIADSKENLWGQAIVSVKSICLFHLL